MRNAQPLDSMSLRMSAPVLFAGVFAGALLLIFGLRPLGFVHHDTTEVVMWANAGMPAGYWKHPPFLPWVVHVWSWFAPANAAGLAVLTALNMTACAFAVWQLAKMPGGESDLHPDRGPIALLLLAAVPFATFMAIKLNHNSILISLWPLTVLAFLRALDRPTALRGVVFGLAAAAAVLAKYYSFLLLAGCLFASLAHRDRAAKFYRSPAPYVTIAVFAAAVFPHVQWMLDQPMSPLGYAFNSAKAVSAQVATADNQKGLFAALLFLAGSPFVAAPLAVVALLLVRYGRKKGTAGSAHPFEHEIIILTAVPWALTALIALAFHLRAPVPWAMPVFLSLPAVFAARIGPIRAGVMRRCAICIAVGLPLLAVAGQIGVRQAIARGTDGVADPRSEIALALTQAWRDATGAPLSIVGGDSRLTSGAVVFSPDHPQGWPTFSSRQAPWIDTARARTDGFAGLCQAADRACVEMAERAADGLTMVRCPISRRKTYLGASGPAFDALLLLALPSGRKTDARNVCPARN